MIDLRGDWSLTLCPGGGEEEKTIPCKVPGNIELALADAGIVPNDLFFGNNIKSLEPFEAYDFIYERRFSLSEEQLRESYDICFEGIDCFAEYFINGVKIGESANALVSYKFPVLKCLKAENTLRVVITSAIAKAMEKNYTPIYGTAQKPDAQYVRKAPHCFGWDIMPRALLGGIWRGVSLVPEKQYYFRDLYMTTEYAEENKAGLLLNFTFSASAKELPLMEVEVSGKCGDSSFIKRSRPFFVSERIFIEIDKPKFWMPRGYGEANLYDVTVTLLKDGLPVASEGFRHGIRTVQLLRTKYTDNDRSGEFKFRINNEDIFCKGTNWVPMDAFHSRDAERYNKALELVSEIGCNMIRCWGGNVYEDHAFFDYCDREGIMVWQDFAMACTNYPQDDEEFDRELKNEVIKVIKKLRGHCSLVVWCGDNECDHLYLKPESNRATREIIPECLRIHDPFREYVPSSPYRSAETFREPEKIRLPEDHLWGKRAYYKDRYYTENTAHFIGEIGYMGCPAPESLKEFISPEKLWPWQDNDEWLTHAVMDRRGMHDKRIKLMADQIHQLTGKAPDSLEEFAIASQISQAEAMKFFIESTRLKKWEKTGILWWNIIDGWSQFSDAAVDYYYRKKLAFYYIKDSQQPLCMIADEIRDWDVDIYMCNDTLKDCGGAYKVTDCESGEVYLEGEYFSERNMNTKLGAVPVYRSEHKALKMEWTAQGKTFTNYKFIYTPPVHLDKYIGIMKKEEKYEKIFSSILYGCRES